MLQELVILIPWAFLIAGIAYLAIQLSDSPTSVYDHPKLGNISGKGFLILAGVPLSWFVIFSLGIAEADWRFILTSLCSTILLISIGCGILCASHTDEATSEDSEKYK